MPTRKSPKKSKSLTRETGSSTAKRTGTPTTTSRKTRGKKILEAPGFHQLIQTNTFAVIEQHGMVVLAFPDEKSRMSLAFDLMSMDKQHSRLAVPAMGQPRDWVLHNQSKLKQVLRVSDLYVPGRNKRIKPKAMPTNGA